MPTIARIVGGAGTGKTSRLLDLMAKSIEAGDIGPMDLGFCTFTRAARSAASERAAERFGVKQDELTNAGWFKTLHAICYRVLGAGKELLAGSAADRKWLEEAIQEACKAGGGASDEGLAAVAFESSSEADAALGLWDASRNRLEPLAAAWERAGAVNDSLPSLEYCEAIVERYEQAKRLDGRCDFTDLLGRFAGWRFYPDGPPTESPPMGLVPEVDVWFLDEQQDTSALLDSVCRRLIAPARWVYVVGDPFQAIYSWAGAEAKYFMGWPVAKQEIMPVSYRCPRAILELGEEVLRDCSDYWDRGIQPASEGGEIERSAFTRGMADEIDPRESWLLLARSNYHARRLAAMLDDRGIPWAPTRGNGGWAAPVTNAGLLALYYLEQQCPIDGKRWRQALKLLPSRTGDQELLTRGTKKKFEQAGREFDEERPIAQSNLVNYGATDALLAAVGNGSWRSLVDGADRFCSAVELWGEEAVMSPRVRCGTVHSSKGAESDHVLLLTSTSQQVARGMETTEGFDEEARVRYVAVTRTKGRLILADERSNHRMEIPA